MTNYVVTGANRGIGLEICRQLSERGESVFAVCRSESDALAVLGVQTLEGIDVSEAADVATLAQQLDGKRVDVLINNAGILRPDTLDTLDFDEMLEQFRVNTLGPLRVSKALLPNMSEGSKIAIVSSRVGSIEDNGSGNNYGYRVSKTAVNMVGMNLHRDLEQRQIAVGILHPGLVATDMTGGRGITAAESARGLIERVDQLNMNNSGSFWHAEGYALPW